MPITSSQWGYYGGYLVFSSVAASGTSGTTGLTSTQWQYWGGYLVFSTAFAPVSTSTGTATTRIRPLISPRLLINRIDIRL